MPILSNQCKGQYIKDFKWVGWHPFCRCFATAITASEQERDKYWNAMAAGEDVTMEHILKLKLHDDCPQIENTKIAAIYHYTRGDIRGFRQFNKHLREGTTNEYEEAYAGLITKGLEKLPPHEGAVYRSMRLNRKGFAAFIQEHQVGSEVVYKGFTSTSEKTRLTMRTLWFLNILPRWMPAFLRTYLA